jgi:hypothetical protein
MLTQDELLQLAQLIDERLERRLKPVQRALRLIQRDQKTLLNLLDREQMRQRKRIERIEQELLISPLD